MRPEHAVSVEQIWKVSLWKYEPDAAARWWQRKFYHWIFVPFLRASFNYVKVPPPKGAVIEGKKTTLFWFEDIGNYDSEDQADIACIGENHCYKPQPFNKTMPDPSAQYSDFTFPRRKNPRPRPEPVLDLLITPRQRHSVLQREVKRLNQVLDQ